MRAAGWAEHDRCLICLNGLVEKEAPRTAENLQVVVTTPSCTETAVRGESTKRSIRDVVRATPEQIERAPRGNIVHRLWNGSCLGQLRCTHA